MQWLKRTVVGSSKVDDSYKHGVPFENKKREYFQLESLLDKLNLAVKEYINLWGEVVRKKTEIYAMLLVFYSSASVPKRQLVDDVFQFHQKPLDGLVSTMARAYRRDLTGEIDKIMSVYPKTKERIEGLIHLRRKWKEKRNAVAAAVSTRGRRLFPERLNELDKEARMAKWMYDMEVSAVQREFENSLSQKASMLDRFLIRMLVADSSFFRGLFRSSEYFSATGRRFLWYREYPAGMPSRVGDPQPSEMDSSTDEDTTDDHNEDGDDAFDVFASSIVVTTPRPSPGPKKKAHRGKCKAPPRRPALSDGDIDSDDDDSEDKDSDFDVEAVLSAMRQSPKIVGHSEMSLAQLSAGSSRCAPPKMKPKRKRSGTGDLRRQKLVTPPKRDRRRAQIAPSVKLQSTSGLGKGKGKGKKGHMKQLSETLETRATFLRQRQSTERVTVGGKPPKSPPKTRVSCPPKPRVSTPPPTATPPLRSTVKPPPRGRIKKGFDEEMRAHKKTQSLTFSSPMMSVIGSELSALLSSSTETPTGIDLRSLLPTEARSQTVFSIQRSETEDATHSDGEEVAFPLVPWGKESWMNEIDKTNASALNFNGPLQKWWTEKSKKGGTPKGYYYYCRSRHPLELVLSNPRIPDFGTMHSLLDPRQQIDITDPRNSAVPNSIMTSTLARRFKQLARSEVLVPTKASLRPEVVPESVRIRKGGTRTRPLKPRPTTPTPMPMRRPKKK